MKVSDIKPNPNNPRIIKDERFKKLVQSIKDFPKMMELRPMVINSDNIVLGGNMRLKAIAELGMKEIPDSWVKKATDLTEEEARRFIIADNVGFGEHDWEVLANEWDLDELTEWGIPDFQLGTEVNSITENELDLTEEFDPIGVSAGMQRVVFLFDGKDEAESWMKQFPSMELKKFNNAWQVNLSTRSI